MELTTVDDIDWDTYRLNDLVLDIQCETTPAGDYYTVFIMDEDNVPLFKIFEGYKGATNRRL